MSFPIKQQNVFCMKVWKATNDVNRQQFVIRESSQVSPRPMLRVYGINSPKKPNFGCIVFKSLVFLVKKFLLFIYFVITSFF